MKESRDVIKRCKKDLQTIAGQQKAFNSASQTGVTTKAKNALEADKRHTQEKQINDKAYVDAINYAFIQLEGAYPSKFYTFFSVNQSLSQAKRVWLVHLKKDLTPEQIKIGIDIALARSNFFPDMADIRRYAKEYALPSLPTAENAYREAAAKSHQIMNGDNVNWSHPLVGTAAERTGWFEIREKPEKEVLPQFKRHYLALTSDLIDSNKDLSQLSLENKEKKLNEAEKAFHYAEKKLIKNYQTTHESDCNLSGRTAINAIKKQLL